jgi:hypothetical protein
MWPGLAAVSGDSDMKTLGKEKVPEWRKDRRVAPPPSATVVTSQRCGLLVEGNLRFV